MDLRLQNISTDRLLLFHFYKTESTSEEHSANHWNDDSEWHQYNLRSIMRVHKIHSSLDHAPASIGCCDDHQGELDPYCLGTKPSLNMYQQWARFRFAKAEISEGARNAESNS